MRSRVPVYASGRACACVNRLRGDYARVWGLVVLVAGVAPAVVVPDSGPLLTHVAPPALPLFFLYGLWPADQMLLISEIMTNEMQNIALTQVDRSASRQEGRSVGRTSAIMDTNLDSNLVVLWWPRIDYQEVFGGNVMIGSHTKSKPFNFQALHSADGELISVG